MSPAWFVLPVTVLFIAECATGNLIRGRSDETAFATKDVLVPREGVDANELSIPVEPPSEPSETTTKTCRQIGEFCMNHTDCCTFSCLGYAKRCVSGSG